MDTNRLRQEYEEWTERQREGYRLAVKMVIWTTVVTISGYIFIGYLVFVLTVAGLIGFLYAFGTAASMEDHIHETRLLAFHIHDYACRKNRVRVLVQNYRDVHIPATWGTNATSARVIEYEETSCDSCSTITIWKPGEPPVLAISG